MQLDQELYGSQVPFWGFRSCFRSCRQLQGCNCVKVLRLGWSGWLTARYGVVKEHLRSDGILQIWFPEQLGGDAGTTASIAKALKQSFPYVRAFQSFDNFGIHFVASMQPLHGASASVLAARLPPAAAADFREWEPNLTVEQLFSRVLSQERSVEKMIAEDPSVPELEDDQPINEYYKLRSWFHYYR